MGSESEQPNGLLFQPHIYELRVLFRCNENENKNCKMLKTLVRSVCRCVCVRARVYVYMCVCASEKENNESLGSQPVPRPLTAARCWVTRSRHDGAPFRGAAENESNTHD